MESAMEDFESVRDNIVQAMQERGWSPRQISVRSYYRVIGILIKDESIDFESVSRIAESFETARTTVFVSEDF